jgi:hypothetical protein
MTTDAIYTCFHCSERSREFRLALERGTTLNLAITKGAVKFSQPLHQLPSLLAAHQKPLIVDVQRVHPVFDAFSKIPFGFNAGAIIGIDGLVLLAERVGFLLPGIGAGGFKNVVLNRNSVARDGLPSLKMAVHTPLAKESPGVAVAVDQKGDVFGVV